MRITWNWLIGDLLYIGRLFVVVLVGVSVAWIPVVSGFPELFHYIQEVTSFLSPPVCAVYVLGVSWKRINEQVRPSQPATRYCCRHCFPSSPSHMFLCRGRFGVWWSDWWLAAFDSFSNTLSMEGRLPAAPTRRIRFLTSSAKCTTYTSAVSYSWSQWSWSSSSAFSPSPSILARYTCLHLPDITLQVPIVVMVITHWPWTMEDKYRRNAFLLS